MSDERIGEILRAAFPDVDSDDPVAYYRSQGDVFQALSLAWLFWPKLVNLHGAIFLALDGDDEVEISTRLRTPLPETYLSSPPMSWAEVVDSYNWFEIDQFFVRWRGPREFVSEAELELSKIIVQVWHARLSDAYPSRIFSVVLAPVDDVGGLRIVVRQESPQLEVPKGWDERRRFVSP